MTDAAVILALPDRDGRAVPTVFVGGAPRVAVEDEAERIRDLPWAEYDDAEVRVAALAWATERWGRPNARMQFREIQALALLVCHLNDGGFLPIGTGWGKTIIALLAADALGARRPLLLIPPTMRVPLDNARTRDYAPSFKVPPNLRIMAYSQLSQASSTEVLEHLAPDVIVADEAHNLRHADAARTRRLIRYLKAHPHTRVVLMSGTLTSKSVKDYAHLAEWALKANSPVPRASFFPILAAFCSVLDAKTVKKDGDGNHFSAEPAPYDWSIFSPLYPDWQDEEDIPKRIETARTRYMERLLSAPGVVGTDTLSVGASLYFIERPLIVPPIVTDALATLLGSATVKGTWQRPDGEELMLAIDVWRCGRQLSQGFYYRWRWPHPDNKPDEADRDWLRTRAAWHRAVRDVCKRNLPHLDSPLLVTQAARRALAGTLKLGGVPRPRQPDRKDYIHGTFDEMWDSQEEADADYQKAQTAYYADLASWPERNRKSEEAARVAGPLVHADDLLLALENWEPHAARRWHGKPTPPTETVWLDAFLVDDAVRYLEEFPRGLVWYADRAMMEALTLRKVRVFGPGTNPEDIAGAYGAALSIHVHKDGKNLQKHSDNLFLDFLPSGSPMEQALSRTHRAGQEEDEVFARYYGHTEPAKNAVAFARNDAAYIQGTLNTPQRLCYGTWL